MNSYIIAAVYHSEEYFEVKAQSKEEALSTVMSGFGRKLGEIHQEIAYRTEISDAIKEIISAKK